MDSSVLLKLSGTSAQLDLRDGSLYRVLFDDVSVNNSVLGLELYFEVGEAEGRVSLGAVTEAESHRKNEHCLDKHPGAG